VAKANGNRPSVIAWRSHGGVRQKLTAHGQKPKLSEANGNNPTPNNQKPMTLKSLAQRNLNLGMSGSLQLPATVDRLARKDE